MRQPDPGSGARDPASGCGGALAREQVRAAMWIKICGNTNLEDARFAAECGANAVGFVFAPSPRQVEADLVRQITESCPGSWRSTAFSWTQVSTRLCRPSAACGLTGVQLHRSSDALLPSRLREHFASFQAGSASCAFCTIKTQEFEQQLTELGRNDALDGVLVDSSTARAVGGTGTSFNWLGAQSSFLRAAPHLRLIAAGGLAPENVKQAIQILAALGSRRGERRRERAGQEGSRAGAGLHPVGAASGSGDRLRRRIQQA